MQKKFEELYSDFFLNALKIDGTFSSRCSAPHFLMPSPSWNSGRRKLLVVGQETLGWGIGEVDASKAVRTLSDFSPTPEMVSRLMATYTEFAFGDSYGGRGSPFWTAFHKWKDDIGCRT